MKRSYKGLIVRVGALLALSAFYLFAYVGLKLKIDELNRTKARLTENNRIAENVRMTLTARYQNLISKGRIESFARDSLGMLPPSDAVGAIAIDRTELRTLQKLLEDHE
jgi:cell division protein FtsB